MFVFFAIIVVAGVLGGFIFALDSTHNHTLTMPWKGESKNTGWAGHVIVGIGGALVAIAASIPIFNFDLTPFTSTGIESKIQQEEKVGGQERQFYTKLAAKELNTTVATPLPPSLETQQLIARNYLELVLYILALGIIGGYSGLRIISGMSDAMMKKLEQEVKAQVDEKTKEIKDEAQKTRSSLATNIKSDKALKKEVDEYKKQLDLMRAAFLIKTEKADEALSILLEQVKEQPENDKVWMWLGSCYRALKQYDKALESSLKAKELSPKEWTYTYNCACYISLANGETSLIISYLEDAVKICKQDVKFENIEILKKYFSEDEDLTFIKKEFDILKLLK